MLMCQISVVKCKQLCKDRKNVYPIGSIKYFYQIVDESTREAAIVDPVAPESVVKAVNEENVTLTTVLTTHHHWQV